MQKITPFLWFTNQAEDAARFYISVFSESPFTKDTSEITRVSRYGKEGYEVHKMPEGTAMTVDFTLDGQQFLALNGGDNFKFSEAISFVINCETQEEVDYYWEKLSAVKESEQCGWVKDKFGLSWQIVPTVLEDLMADLDKEKAGRVMNAMLQMKKIDIAKLKEAAAGK